MKKKQDYFEQIEKIRIAKTKKKKTTLFFTTIKTTIPISSFEKYIKIRRKKFHNQLKEDIASFHNKNQGKQELLETKTKTTMPKYRSK